MKTYIVKLRGNKANKVSDLTFEIQAKNKSIAFNVVYSHFNQKKSEKDYFQQLLKESVSSYGFDETLAFKYRVMRSQVN